jgi:hypothetical protein
VAERQVADVLANARDMLATAEMGLKDLVGPDPKRRTPGIRNVAVFGRSVSFVLQNIRSIDPERFNPWYERQVDGMRDDPLLTYFRDLRNEILKEGGPALQSSLHIESLTGAEMAALTTNPPPGARAFFIGDSLGGSGWEIELPDGTTEKYYVALPEELQVEMKLHFPNPPTEHQGNVITDTSLENLARLYIAYLASLVADAEQHFGSEP